MISLLVPAAVRCNRLPGFSVAAAVTYTAAVGSAPGNTTACGVELAVVSSRRWNYNAAEVIFFGTGHIRAAVAVSLFNTTIANFPVHLGSLGGGQKGKDNGSVELHNVVLVKVESVYVV